MKWKADKVKAEEPEQMTEKQKGKAEKAVREHIAKTRAEVEQYSRQVVSDDIKADPV